ncbi:MAG: hypothetical protein B6D64_10210 [Bacteroidetes bacterium 4484_276]|nr:MAG: hypothetical protein B6D64_10210 [Bacteroidetes bacterium 4484_276]
MRKLNFSNILPYLVAIIIFILIATIYFSPVLEGKKLKPNDVTNFKGMSKEIVDFREKTGEEPLWTNSMFGGMPAYQISTEYNGNLMRYVDYIFRLGLPYPIWIVFLYMIGFYILLLVLRVNPWLAITGAIAFGFSSYFFIIIEAGHNSKAHAIGYMAPVVAGFILTYRRKYLLGGLMTLLFLALELKSGHPQITYYLMLALLLFGITELVSAIREKNYLPFIKSSAVLIIAILLAVLTNITSLWATWEYGKYTIRGKTELSTEKENRTSGLDKDYATQWSYGIDETLTLLIPDAKGGASGVIGKNESVLKGVDSRFKEYVATSANRYWGNQPFTSGPVYAGAIVMFLFFLGLFTVKGKLKWWILAATILSIMLSWGKNFMPLTEFFLDYFPGYNKFRAVSMILVIAELMIPILAVLALLQILDDPKSFTKKLKIFGYPVNPFYLAFGLTGGLALLFALFPGAFFNFLSDQEIQSIASQQQSDPTYGKQLAEFFANVEIARKNIFKADAIRSFIYILLAAGVIFAFAKNKLKKEYAIGLVTLLILIDMWSVDKRYLNNDSFVRKSKTEEPFKMTKADQFILKDKDPDFRVLNLTVDPFADASTSYFHKSIGGYHGAKLRRYQELYDHQLKNKMNMAVLNMLNTKYIIQPDNNKQPTVMPNIQACGNAWFVKDIKWVKNADEELAALSDFDPEKIAVIDEQFKPDLEGFTPTNDSTALIKLISYAPNHLKYQVNTHNDQLAVFSEIYYPKGWNAYVDGKLAPHIRVDYVLRAMVIPAGKHLVEFKFEPKAYYIGEKISLASSLLVLLLVLGYFVYEIKRYFASTKEE